MFRRGLCENNKHTRVDEENSKKSAQEATRKIQISIMLISNNKTIHRLIIVYSFAVNEMEVFYEGIERRRGLHALPVPLDDEKSWKRTRLMLNWI
jgi:hypothetical protein